MRIIYTSEIRKSPKVVFPWIAEPNKALQWQKNVKRAEILIHKPGMVGTIFKEELEENGRSLEMHGTVTKFVEDQIVAFHLDSKIHKVDVSYLLEGIHDVTRVTIDARIEWKFPLNLLSVFIGRKMKAGIVEQLRRETFELKRIIEAS